MILRLCARISKLSKIVYARGFETRNFSSIRHFNVRFSIAQRMALGSILRSHFAPFQWSHVSNCCAEVRFPSTKQRAFYLRSSLLLKRKQEYVRNLSRFCSHIFHAIRLIAQIFSPPTWFLFYNFFVIQQFDLLILSFPISSIFSQTAGFVLVLHPYTNTTITRGLTHTFLPRHMSA